jgi:hypothetical protein
MDNGELRFRLLADRDNTAYIRTEGGDTGAWQNAHYHEHVLETYIVESGWIVLCELIAGVYQYTKFNANEMFTTKPNVVHNVYMSARTVIHTVKHGTASALTGTDRIGDAPEPKAMSTENAALSESALLRIARAPASRQPSAMPECVTEVAHTDDAKLAAQLYSPEYRHFDTLIWQTPVWSFTVLSIAFIAATNIKPDGAIAKFLSLTSPELIFTATFGALGIFLVLVAYALYRFRWHQAGVVTKPPSSRYFKTQALLQLFVSIEAISLLLLCIRGIPAPENTPWLGNAVVVLMVLAIPASHYFLENSVHLRASLIKKTFSPS